MNNKKPKGIKIDPSRLKHKTHPSGTKIKFQGHRRINHRMVPKSLGSALSHLLGVNENTFQDGISFSSYRIDFKPNRENKEH